MLSIPFFVFLIIYALFAVIFIIFYLINFNHLISTASFTLAGFLITATVFIMALACLGLTWLALGDLSWSQPITIFNGNWLGSTFNSNSPF